MLINASPDLGQQLRRTPALWPKQTRHSPISTVILTSAEIDHVAGLITLRERHDFDIVAFPPVHAAIAGNPMFTPLQARRVQARAGSPFNATADMHLTLFAVPGKVPLYLEGSTPQSDHDEGEAAGVFVSGGSATLVYIPGCAELTDDVAAWAARADIVIFDGTLFDDEEMRRTRLGEKTGRRMGHMPMTGPGGSLDWLAGLSARRKIYSHINNSNPVLIEGSHERGLVEAAGIEIAYDGLELAL
jgi:pyrroloquinoline quinone biosynthesis protein B